MAGTSGRVRRILRSVAVLALLGGLSACASGGMGSAGDSGVDSDSAGGAPAPEEGSAPAADGAGLDRSVIVTGSMTLRVDDALEAADEATRIVEAAGGRVDDRSEQSPADDSPASAYLTVRIPADDLTATVAELKTLGEVRDLSLDREDVTLQVTDLDARIQALEVSIARLEGLMAQAGSVADLLAAESAMTERQAELDSLRAQRTYLGEQVDLSTMYLSLVPRATTPAPAPGGFWGGVQTGWTALVSAFNQVVVVLGVLVPWAVLAAVVLGLVLIVRRSRPARPRPPYVAHPGAHPRPGVPGGPLQGGPPVDRQPAPHAPGQAPQAPGQQATGPGPQPPAHS